MLLRLRRPLRIVTAYVGACLVAGLILSVIVVGVSIAYLRRQLSDR